MWKEVISALESDSKYIKFGEPATQNELAEISKTLKVDLPKDLTEMLQEINGDGDFLLSATEILEANLNLREVYQDYFMTLDCLLFVARNGAGDFYGYPIFANGELDSDKIYYWSHETDDRIWVADSLADLVKGWYQETLAY